MYKNKNLRSLFLLALFILAMFMEAEGAVSMKRKRVEGIEIFVIDADLTDSDTFVTIDTARGFPGADEEFHSMLGRLKPKAAINGTFFATDTLLPTGDVVINGNLRYSGRFGTALCITGDNKARFIRVPDGYSVEWSGYQTVIACGPRLVKKGQAKVEAQKEGFSDPHVLGYAERSAAGISSDGHLLLVSTVEAVSLQRLALIMKSLGAVDAMNLDGGTSTAISYDGKALLSPGRRLTNLISVYEKKPPVKDFGPVRIKTDEDARRLVNNAHVLYKNGMRKLKEGNPVEAEKDVNRACEKNPTAANFIALAGIRASLGKNNEAAQAYADAARIYYNMKKWNEADANAAKALALDSGNKEAGEVLTLARRKRGLPPPLLRTSTPPLVSGHIKKPSPVKVKPETTPVRVTQAAPVKPVFTPQKAEKEAGIRAMTPLVTGVFILMGIIAAAIVMSGSLKGGNNKNLTHQETVDDFEQRWEY